MAKRSKKKSLRLLLIILLLGLLPLAGYFGLERILEWYFLKEAHQLIEKEQMGALSSDYGYVWSEINLARKMGRINEDLSSQDTLSKNIAKPTLPASASTLVRIDPNMPSLSAVRELNQILKTSNAIEILDRNGYPLGEIRTTHVRLKLREISPILIQAILSAEDNHFRTRKLAYEYRAFVRAAISSLWRGIKTGKFPRPRGTSTIDQQVAKFLLSKFDAHGYVYSERSLTRKLKEIKLAQALRLTYTPDEILQVYLNHCVSAGSGLTGCHDISQGLFGKKPSELDICQSLYISRMMKWNRSVPSKIIRQVKVDMPRLSTAFNWNPSKQDSILRALDKIKLLKPSRIASEHNPLIDLANESWLLFCQRSGMPEEEIREMDFTRPGTMIRRKGNLKIRLTIDLRLQKKLEELVKARGFGRDTLLFTDVRIGSFGINVSSEKTVRDTLRRITILKRDSLFSETGSGYFTKLHQGDTLVTNIRYSRLSRDSLRRSLYFYTRDSMRVRGQYFSYAMMNSRTGELLAYYSRDDIGSRLSSLLRNRTPNGSSVAKPILYSMNYDFGHFQPFDKISDSVEIPQPTAWARQFLQENGRNVGMIYLNTSAPGGYPVSNHGKIFEGYDYLYNHLTESNNILCVEMIYRLNGPLTNPDGSPGDRQALLARLGDTVLLKPGSMPGTITGTQLYARIAAVTGAPTDSILDMRGRIPLPVDYYSVALGTLELSLYEEMHLFNALYGNTIIERPVQHPSLVLRSISVSGNALSISDTLLRRQLFGHFNRIRPSLLGLHKRLISNPADQLAAYDIALDSTPAGEDTLLSNFAKSGTTDDIIRPYDRDITTKERTNYGLWNAVLRLSLPASAYEGLQKTGKTVEKDSVPEREVLDVTLSCVGECNERRTGARDGKSLHKFASAGLLHTYGIPVDSGFFSGYEKELIRTTPDSIVNPEKWRAQQERSQEPLSTKIKNFFFGNKGSK